jgi:non-heme chloroperoxidase
MNASTTFPSPVESHDEDLNKQAKPGHGVPSQDPDPAAQYPLTPKEAEREAKSVLAGGGVVGGAALGAAIGSAVGGPVGVVVGGTVGAIAGAVGGAAAGAVMKTADSDSTEAPTVLIPHQ